MRYGNKSSKRIYWFLLTGFLIMAISSHFFSADASAQWEEWSNWPSYNQSYISPFTTSGPSIYNWSVPSYDTWSPSTNFFNPSYNNVFQANLNSLYNPWLNPINTFPPSFQPSLNLLSGLWQPVQLPQLNLISNPIYNFPIINFPPYSPPQPYRTPIKRPPDPDPADCPWSLDGTWESQILSSASGDLTFYQGGDTSFEMSNHSLSLGIGRIAEIQYTPTSGEAPISFRIVFDSDYTGEFTGIANNSLCPKGCSCVWPGAFDVDGEYVIKNGFGQIADRGVFELR